MNEYDPDNDAPGNRKVETPRDANGNPDWQALGRPENASSDKPANPFAQAMREGSAPLSPVPPDAEPTDDFGVDELGSLDGHGGVGVPPDGGEPTDPAPAGGEDPAEEPQAADGAVFYTQRGLEDIEGASMQSYPDMNAERGPDGRPRSLADQLVVPLHEPIRIRQPDGREQTLDPAQTPFAVRDVRGRIHALSADEHAALVAQGQKIEEDQGAAGGTQKVSLLAGGMAAIVNAIRNGQSKVEQAKDSKALEQANAAATERRRYEPWWSSRAQADVSTANEHIAKAADLGRKIRGHPDVRESVSDLHDAKKRTMLDPNDIDAWMDYRKAGRDISRHIANNPELSEDLQTMRGHLDQTESAVKSAIEAADEAKGQDYAMRDALQGLDTKGLEEATNHLRTHTNDGQNDSGEDTESQVERMRELMKAVQTTMTKLVHRIMRLGKGADSGPEPAG